MHQIPAGHLLEMLFQLPHRERCFWAAAGIPGLKKQFGKVLGIMKAIPHRGSWSSLECIERWNMEDAFCAHARFTEWSGNGGRGRRVTRKYQGTDEEDLSSSLDLGTNLLGNLIQVTSSLGASVFSPVKWSASEHWSLTSYRA